ncbi:phenazine biosynthesis protein PhzD [Kitasatospora sp. NE20-6]|uniref:isochorismatase family protein n=1 Tax=Kitasatospora sp. NE20-6 TaxID=2859066 RepID=UPI0034DC7475
MAGLPAITPYPMPAATDLPASTARWTVDPDRAVLLLHDMQRYFLQPLPAEPGDALLRNAVRLREEAARRGVPVAYTAQPGGMSDTDRGLLKDFWGPGMRVAPEDRKVVDPLEPVEDDWVFTKWRYSAFFRTDLLERLRRAGRDQLVVCGVYAHVGVLMSAVDAFTNDIETFLVADAVADFSAAYHQQALAYAAERCAVVTTTAAVADALATGLVAHGGRR